MPRKSLRKKALDLMQAKVNKLTLMYHMREAMDEEESLADDELIEQSEILEQMKKKRYLYRSSSYRKDRKNFDLEDTLSDKSKNMNDEEFLSLFRLTRDSFKLFLAEMIDKKAFVVKNKSSHQRPVAFQLLVYLYRVGREGTNGGSGLVSYFLESEKVPSIIMSGELCLLFMR